jgi:hypothetical protein
MSNIVIDIAAEFVGKPAFKQAETATAALTKSVKNLAKGLGAAYLAQKALVYGVNAAKAFAEDQKAAQSLANTLENLGLGFNGSAKEINDYISNLEKQTGVLDDELRPAMDRLLRATSSITESQKLLSLALDVSAGTGKTLTQVSQSLQKAYLGQTQALGRLGVGLSKAELSSGSFEEISARLSTLFAGQAITAAEGYAGSLAKLKVATNNASEAIGESLFTAVGTLSGSDGLPKTIELIESLSTKISTAIVRIARLARNISILAAGNPLESIRDLQAATRADQLADAKAQGNFGGVYAEVYKAQVATNAAQKKGLSQSKAITKETAAQLKNKRLALAIDKANLALGKSEEVFDMDKIQNAAALKNQAEQLGKATNGAQLLQIANDTARLNVKKSIFALEEAIASKDEASIKAATAKLNEDLKVLGVLQNQDIKLKDIKSILETLKPKDLINIDNLKEALDLLKQIAMPVGGGGAASLGAPSMPSSLNPISGAGGVRAPKAFSNQELQYFEDLNSAMYADLFAGGKNPFATSSSSGTPVTIVNNFGVVGDPNAAAELMNQTLQQAIDRGTLRVTA